MPSLHYAFQTESQKMRLEANTLIPTSLWRLMCMNIPFTANEESVKYEGLGEMPIMNEFLRERQIQTIAGRPMTLTMKKFESTISSDVIKLKTQSGAYSFQTAQKSMFSNAVNFPNIRFFRCIEDTSYTDTVDGVTLFSATHPILGSSAVNSNLKSGTGVTAAHIVADWITGRNAFLAMQTRAGRIFYSLDGLDFHIIYPTALTDPMTEVFISERNSTSATIGRFKGAATLHCCDMLTDVNDWYISIVMPGLAPFFFAESVPLDVGKYSYAQEFDANIMKFGVMWWMEIFPGYYWLIVKIQNA